MFDDLSHAFEAWTAAERRLSHAFEVWALAETAAQTAVKGNLPCAAGQAALAAHKAKAAHDRALAAYDRAQTILTDAHKAAQAAMNAWD